MELSVVVSTHNRLRYLKKQLYCFEEQTCSSFEVIVADDGSSDGTEEWCTKAIADNTFGFSLKYIKQKHQDFRLAAVRNLGTSIAKGKRVLFTDNDCWHTINSLKAHATVSTKTIGIGLIYWLEEKESQKLLNKEDSLLIEKELFQIAKPEKRTFKREPMAVEVWGGNFSIDRNLLLRAGGHDEAFNGYGGEEVDLALRLTRHFDKSEIHVLHDSIAFHLWHKRGNIHKLKSGQDLLSKRRSGGYYRQEQKGSL